MMREKPDARALVGKSAPKVELEVLVDLIRAAAEIARVLSDSEHICVGGDADIIEKFLDVAGQTAAVAGDDEADALRVTHVGNGGRLAHHDYVRVAQALGDVFRKVKAVAAARIAENYVFAHCVCSLSLKNYFMPRL